MTIFYLDKEIKTCAGKAATTLSKLRKSVKSNKRLTMKTKVLIYQTGMLRNFLYGSEMWTAEGLRKKETYFLSLQNNEATKQSNSRVVYTDKPPSMMTRQTNT